MVRLRSMRQLAYLCSMLVFCLYIAPIGQVLAAGEPVPELIKHRVVVFPFAVADEIAQKQMGQDMAATLAEVLKNTGVYEVILFSKRHPSVQRAVVVEGRLKATDLLDSYDPSNSTVNADGLTNKGLALKIGAEMGGDLVIIGDIASYRYDATKNSCEVLADVDMVDVHTAETSKRVTVTGRTPDGSKAKTEQECAAIAAGNAVTKIIEGLGVKPTLAVGQAAAVNKKKKASRRNLLLLVALGLGLGLAFSGGSSGDHSSGPVEPPPPPPVP
jgi:hypothetical protein